MTLNEFVNEVYRLAIDYVGRETQINVSNLSNREQNRVKSLIKDTAVQVGTEYDSNNFPRVVTRRVSESIYNAVTDAGGQLPNSFVVDFEEQIERNIGDELLVSLYNDESLSNADSPETPTEPETPRARTTETTQAVDAAQALDPANLPEELNGVAEKLYQNYPSEYNSLDEAKQRLLMAIDENFLYVNNDSVFYPSFTLEEMSRNGDRLVDFNELAEILIEHGKETGWSVRLELPVAANSAYISELGPDELNELQPYNRYDITKKAVNNTPEAYKTTRIIFPEDNDAVQKKLADYLDTRYDILKDNNVKFQNLINSDGSNGPLITTSQATHSRFGILLNRINRNPFIQAALDRAGDKFSWRIIGVRGYAGSSRYNQNTLHKMVVNKKGIGEFFKKILEKADGTRYQELIKKPSYFLGLVHTDVNGNQHIVSIAESDQPGHRRFENDVGTARRGLRVTEASIQTNFLDFTPDATIGYYPNPLIDNAKKVKNLQSRGVRVAVEWFRGLLAVADADGVVLFNSPINSYVANTYQLGGFLFNKLDAMTMTAGEQKNADVIRSSMVRYPNANNEIDSGWKTKLSNKEFSIDLEYDEVLWGEPYDIQGTATKKIFNDINKSPRHLQMIGLANADLSIFPKRKVIDAMFQLGFGGQPWNVGLILDHLLQGNTTFVTKTGDVSRLIKELEDLITPKDLMALIFKTESFELMTGVNVMDVPEETLQKLGISKFELGGIGWDLHHTGNDLIATGPLKDLWGTGASQWNIFENLLLMNIPESKRIELGIKTRTDLEQELLIDITEDGPEIDTNQVINDWITDGSQTPTAITSSTPDTPDAFGSQRLSQYIQTINLEDTYQNLRTGLQLEPEAGAYYPYDSTQSTFTGASGHYSNGDAQLTLLSDVFEVDAERIADVFTGVQHGYFSGRNVLSERAKHLFTRNMNYWIKQLGNRADENILLSSDIEFVGTEKFGNEQFPRQYYEASVIYQETLADGRIQLSKNYTTIEVITNTDSDGNIMNSISSNIAFGDSQVNIVNTAFTQVMNELGIDIEPGITDRTASMVDRVHPVGRIARAIGITDGDFENTRITLGSREGDILQYKSQLVSPDELAERYRWMQEDLVTIQNQTPTGRVTPNQVSPQQIYSIVEFDSLFRPIPELDEINNKLTKLFDLVDNRIDGAVQIYFKLPSSDPQDLPRYFSIAKRKGQNIEISSRLTLQRLSEFGIEIDGQTIKTNNPISMTNVEFLVPNKDIYNGVLESNIQNIFPNDTPTYSTIDVVVSDQNFIKNGVTTQLVNDDNLPRIHAGYSLGQNLNGIEGTDFYGVPFNPDRPPVGLNPDKQTLRKMAKSFSQTKTGKTLGYAWKTLDIGETLISKAFAQAQKAALAAGAVSLGGVAATAATVWAAYEVANLIIAAMQGIPELANVFAKRNEILANGEDWEKQIVEETFWQDYGPELLEILQEAGERSPSEILSDKIWTFTLDNLFRQSQGEVFEDALIDNSEELDIREDLWKAQVPDDYKVQLMQDNIDYDKVLNGYYNNRPEANVIMNRTLQLANTVYNRDR